MLKTLLFAFVALLFSGAVPAGRVCAPPLPDALVETGNPLLAVAGRPYAEYHDTYMQVVGSLLHGDSLSRVRLAALFREAAAADKTGEWKLISDMVANTVRFYESRRGGYTWSPDYTAEAFSDKMVAIARSAGQKGFPLVRIFGLYQAAEGYGVFVQDYEQAFACYLEAAAMLDTITTREFPPRPHIYNHLANLYYTFREYGDAIRYFGKVTTDPDVPANYYKALYPAVNGMAQSYRYGYGDYDRSDSCYKRLLDLTRDNETDRAVWEGITEANIGYNYCLRRQPDVALKWLVPAVGKITRPNDFRFVSQRAVDVAGIYLQKGDRATAKRYIDMALDYHARTRIPEKESRLYEVLTRYHTLTGNSKAAAAYLDSTLTTGAREAQAFSGLVLRRVEQRLRAADKKLLEHRIDAERAQSRMYLHTAMLTGAALVAILVLLGLTLFFYRRKRNAYRELVRRSQQWAGIEVPDAERAEPDNCGEALIALLQEAVRDDVGAAEAGPSADRHDEMIMAEIEKAMTERKVYRRTDLTLDVLAKEVGFNRYYLSCALNRCTGRNFNSYVNEYRVKEAVRIMSEPGADNLTADAIAFEAGFNDRQALHRVFKKITGLSPREFRMNRTK